MNRRTKIWIILGIVLLPVAGYVLLYLFAFLYGSGLFHAILFPWRMNTLLYRMDHQALLAACRTLIDQGYKGKYIFHGINRHPDVDKFPKEIIALKPTYVVVSDKYVHIEMWGGMSHYGINAYAEDYIAPPPDHYYGDMKLLEGLWFYSDFLQLGQPVVYGAEAKRKPVAGPEPVVFSAMLSKSKGYKHALLWLYASDNDSDLLGFGIREEHADANDHKTKHINSVSNKI